MVPRGQVRRVASAKPVWSAQVILFHMWRLSDQRPLCTQDIGVLIPLSSLNGSRTRVPAEGNWVSGRLLPSAAPPSGCTGTPAAPNTRKWSQSPFPNTITDAAGCKYIHIFLDLVDVVQDMGAWPGKGHGYVSGKRTWGTWLRSLDILVSVGKVYQEPTQ